MKKKDQIKPAGVQLCEAMMKLYPNNWVEIEVHFDPKITKEVHKYLMKIEEAHKKAAHSKLQFDSMTGGKVWIKANGPGYGLVPDPSIIPDKSNMR